MKLAKVRLYRARNASRSDRVIQPLTSLMLDEKSWRILRMSILNLMLDWTLGSRSRYLRVDFVRKHCLFWRTSFVNSRPRPMSRSSSVSRRKTIVPALRVLAVSFRETSPIRTHLGENP